MLTITITAEEAGALKKALEAYISELRMEITHTDRLAFRDELKRRKALLNGIIAKIERGVES